MKQRLYLDTSIIGGYFDKEFALWTKPLIDKIRNHIHIAVISDITISEIQPAPDFIKELLEEIINIGAELVYGDTESEELADIYLLEGALNSKSLEDANHIALATIENVSTLVSWNFKHIVNLNRIRLFNSVNLKNGYNILEIRSPRELIEP
jgi:hypothetical protein